MEFPRFFEVFEEYLIIGDDSKIISFYPGLPAGIK
jgi:hypothetical protein